MVSAPAFTSTQLPALGLRLSLRQRVLSNRAVLMITPEPLRNGYRHSVTDQLVQVGFQQPAEAR